MKKKFFILNKGFTLVELIITLSIFVMMTGFLVAKYGNFNQNISLTNLAYDIALIARNAQSYGINVKSRPIISPSPSSGATTAFSSDFNYPYGIFIPLVSGNGIFYKYIHFFADTFPLGSPDGLYFGGNTLDEPGADIGDLLISTYNFKNGASMASMCTSQGGPCDAYPCELHITFRRPDPSARIMGRIFCSASAITYASYEYAELQIKSPDGKMKKIIFRSTGQISVSES